MKESRHKSGRAIYWLVNKSQYTAMRCASMDICFNLLLISRFTSISMNLKSQTYSRESLHADYSDFPR